MHTYLSADFIKFFIPLSGAVIAWYLAEYRKRASEEYIRKEERYRELILALRGFYIGSEDPAQRQAFLDQVRMCWLYCPDEVITCAYAFLLSVHAQMTSDDRTKEMALGRVMSAIRNDLISRRIVKATLLTATDFRHFGISDAGISVGSKE
jgi:hypothetical protein